MGTQNLGFPPEIVRFASYSFIEIALRGRLPGLVGRSRGGAGTQTGTVAWDGVNGSNARVAVHHRVWENPLPEIEAKSIDFSSTPTACEPFLIATMVER